AHAFSAVAKVVHASVHSVASAWQVVEAHSANDSLSHRSSHQDIVTRLPNHMWASSWSTVRARRSTRASGTLPRKTSVSLMVSTAALSISPTLSSGLSRCTYLASGND